jgi:Mg2+/Co2+ transporter CorC
VPQVNETILIDRLSFHVLRADSRRIYTLLVTPMPLAGDAG